MYIKNNCNVFVSCTEKNIIALNNIFIESDNKFHIYNTNGIILNGKMNINGNNNKISIETIKLNDIYSYIRREGKLTEIESQTLYSMYGNSTLNVNFIRKN